MSVPFSSDLTKLALFKKEKKMIYRTVALCIAVAVIACSVQARAQTAPPQPGEPPAYEAPLTNDEIVKLTKAGLGDGPIVAKIKQASSETLDVSTDSLIALRQQKVSSAVIEAMVERVAKDGARSETQAAERQKIEKEADAAKAAATEASDGDQTAAVLHTKVGDITIRLFTDRAPNHVQNFVNLSNSGFYDGTLFHRVIKDFIVQGGDPLTKNPANALIWGNGGQMNATGQQITLAPEFNATPHKRGVVSMARSAAPDSASSQFFIVLKDNTNLDGQYTVFGEVVKGMDVVDRVATVSDPELDPSRPNFAKPRRYVALTSVDILQNGRAIPHN